MGIIKKLRGLFYGWWIIIASIILNMTVGGITVYGFTAFYNPIVKEMGWSRAETGFAFSLRSIEGGIVMPLVGLFIDRIGVRKCTFIGILIIGTAFMLMSKISSLNTFYVTFLILALGNTMGMGMGQFTAVANWFSRRRSRAMGFLSVGFGISGLMTPVLVYLINTYGWRKSLFGLGFAVWAIGLPIAMILRHRPEPYGYLPDGDKPGDPVALETSPDVGARGHRYPRWGARGTSEEGLTLRECFKTQNFWMFMLLGVVSAAAMSSMNVLVIPHLTSVGIAESIAALTVTGITLSSLTGRLGFSQLGDTHDKKRLLVICEVLKAAGIFLFAIIHTPWMIIPFLFFYGPGFGGPIPLTMAMQADCFGTRAFGSIMGIRALGMTIFGIVAPLFAGWVYDTQGTYRLAFIIFAFLECFAIPAIMMLKIPARGKLGTEVLEKAAS